MNSVRFNFKKLITFLLTFAVVLGTVFCTPVIQPIEAEATTVDQYKDMIADLEKEQAEIEKEISNLKGEKADQNKIRAAIQKKINNTKEQIAACNKQISDLDAVIVDTENSIAQKQEQLEELKYTFRQRLRAIFMSGGSTNSSLAILLSANNLEQLLTKSELTKTISAYDRALTDKIVTEMKAIEDSRVVIEQLREEQKATKATLDQKQSELNSQIKEVNSIIGGLNSDIGQLQDKADELEKAQKEYEQAIKDAQNVGSNQKHDGEFAWPCPGFYNISSPYGYRTHPISGKWKFHKGIDISGGPIKGKPIVAAADGIVSIAKYNKGGYGYYVMVNHGKKDGDTYVTLYAHMTKYIVKEGQYVRRGQTIGYVGTSGASTGYHLHFEVRINGDTTNPMNYLN